MDSPPSPRHGWKRNPVNGRLTKKKVSSLSHKMNLYEITQEDDVTFLNGVVIRSASQKLLEEYNSRKITVQHYRGEALTGDQFYRELRNDPGVSQKMLHRFQSWRGKHETIEELLGEPPSTEPMTEEEIEREIDRKRLKDTPRYRNAYRSHNHAIRVKRERK